MIQVATEASCSPWTEGNYWDKDEKTGWESEVEIYGQGFHGIGTKCATNLSIELVFQSHLTALEVWNQVLQMTSDLQKEEKQRKNLLKRMCMFVQLVCHFRVERTLKEVTCIMQLETKRSVRSHILKAQGRKYKLMSPGKTKTHTKLLVHLI